MKRYLTVSFLWVMKKNDISEKLLLKVTQKEIYMALSF